MGDEDVIADLHDERLTCNPGFGAQNRVAEAARFGCSTATNAAPNWLESSWNTR